MSVISFLGCYIEMVSMEMFTYLHFILYKLYPKATEISAFQIISSLVVTDRPCVDTILHPMLDEVLGDMWEPSSRD